MTLKAYAVTEEYENRGGILFAEHAIVARRAGANEFNDGEFHGVSCRRAAWADSYAPGPVPFAVQFAHGWWQECAGCYVVIRDGDEYEDGETWRPFLCEEIVEDEHGIFHNRACHDEYVARRARIKAREQEALDYFRARLLAKLPGITFDAGDRNHVYVTEREGHLIVEQVIIAFRFPGCSIGAAHYRYDAGAGDRLPAKPEVTICYGDRDAWDAWCASAFAVPA